MNNSKPPFIDTFININGSIVAKKDAKISVFDRGFLYGDSIYEVAYSRDSTLYFFNDHLERLFVSAALLKMNITYSKDQLIDQCLKTLKEANIPEAYIRIILTRGESELSLDPTESKSNNLIIIVKPKPVHPPLYYQQGIKLKVVSVLRNDSRSTNPEAKSGNYLNNVMAISEAKSFGFNDAIMLNGENKITEGSSFNFWLVKNDVIYTPGAEAGLLKGITREKLIEICKVNKLELKIKALTLKDIEQADEAFITSSTREVMPVGQIDNKKFEVDKFKVTKNLQGLFKDYLKQSSQGLKY